MKVSRTPSCAPTPRAAADGGRDGLTKETVNAWLDGEPSPDPLLEQLLCALRELGTSDR